MSSRSMTRGRPRVHYPSRPFFWVVIAILAIILLAFIVRWAGGGVLDLRLGYFVLNVGFT
jgi:hypothetical protein